MKYPNLEREMKERKITIEKLAESINQDIETAKNYLNGSSEPSVKEALAVQEYLLPDLSLAYIFHSESDHEALIK